MGPRDFFLQFCPYTAQEDTGVDTGPCRSARTSKPVNCKITIRLQHHTNYKTPYDEKQSVSNGKSEYDIAGRTHSVEKKERILRPAAIICDADNSGTEVHGN